MITTLCSMNYYTQYFKNIVKILTKFDFIFSKNTIPNSYLHNYCTATTNITSLKLNFTFSVNKNIK